MSLSDVVVMSRGIRSQHHISRSDVGWHQLQQQKYQMAQCPVPAARAPKNVVGLQGLGLQGLGFRVLILIFIIRIFPKIRILELIPDGRINFRFLRTTKIKI